MTTYKVLFVPVDNNATTPEGSVAQKIALAAIINNPDIAIAEVTVEK